MAIAAADTSLRKSAIWRGLPACAWLAGLVVYFIAKSLAGARVTVWINDIAWTIAAAAAAAMCFRTVRLLPPPPRTSWRFFGLACASWLIGQLIWDYNQLVRQIAMPFPDHRWLAADAAARDRYGILFGQHSESMRVRC